MARWRCGLTRTNRRTIAALIAASALLLALVSGDAQVSPSAAPPVAIEVHSESITAFDLFPNTPHVETVVVLRSG